jgi:hypothetical protein
MATAPPSTTRPRPARRAASAPRWRRWLLLGLFFGLGYGLTHRLLEVPWGEGSSKAPTFKPKSTPSGTPLGELRQQKGDESKPLAADLEDLARQQREEKKKQEALDEQTQRQDTAIEEEKKRLEADRLRLEEMGSSQEPPTPEATTPEVPQLPPPTPPPIEQPAPPAAQAPREAPATTP